MSRLSKNPIALEPAFLLGAVLFLSFIYFYEGGGWNQNSRFDLLRAIVEKHTLTIDAYHENTQDKAHFRGHYYSDKAPGLVFLAVPVALAARPALRLAGVDPESPPGEYLLSYLLTAFVVALPTAFAGACLFFVAVRLGAGVGGAAFATVVMGLGTPIWAYASLFWAHALVGACLAFAFAAALKLEVPKTESATKVDFGIGHPGDITARSEFLWALAVGLAAGWATVTEYPAAPASAMLALFALAMVWSRGAAARWRAVAGVALGAGICVVVLLGYLHAAFGAFRPSYSYYDSTPFSFMQQQGYMGLTYPHADRLLKLLFGCARGLFVASPVMVVAPVGLWWLSKGKMHRAAALIAGTIATYYFLFNASFYWWKAGLAFGPRYAGACIPLLCLGVAIAWERTRPVWRWVVVALGSCSVALTLIVISTSSQLAMQDTCPIVHSSLPSFFSGDLALNRESMLTAAEAGGKYGAFNLGQLIGLHGIASLIPLLLMWGIAAILWIRIRDRDCSAKNDSKAQQGNPADLRVR